MSSNNVVPGPGDPSIEDSQGYLSASDVPGELCPGLNLRVDATSVGIYHAASGSTGPLVVDLSAYIGDYLCTEDVPQSTIDDLAANPGDYYVQVNSESYPDGATRGQLAIVVPTVYMDALAWFCPTGMHFPASDAAIDKDCGAISIPGQDFPPGAGATSTDYAGAFPWDVRVQGPAGYDERLADASLAAGGACDDTHICRFGWMPFTFFNLQPGPTTIDMAAIPAGMTLAYTHAVIENEPGLAITYGPGGHVAFDLTGAYRAVPIVRYYFTGSPKLAPPTEAAPVVDLAQAPVSANGAIALALQYGAIEMGNGPISYAVQVATDGGSFKAITTSTKPFATVREQPSHSYQFRVQATDVFGVKSSWVAGDPVQLDVIQDTDPLIQYYGGFPTGWQTGPTKGAAGGTTTWTTDGWAAADLGTEAIAIGVVMPLEPSGGHATVQLGYSSQTIDLSASTWQPRQVVAVQDVAGLGTQRVGIQAWGDGRVDLDEIIVLR